MQPFLTAVHPWPRLRGPILLAVTACLQLACSGVPTPVETGTEHGTSSAGETSATGGARDSDDTSSSGSDETSSSGADETSASGSDETSASDSDDTSSPGEVSDPCERYIECVTAVGDIPLSPIVAVYGESGTCWGQFDAEICEHDCRAGLTALGQANPDVDACAECTNDEECAFLGQGLGCYGGECRELLPGNGDVFDPCYVDGDCPAGTECHEGQQTGPIGDGTCLDTCFNGTDAECDLEGFWCYESLGWCLSPGDPLLCDVLSGDCEGCLAAGCTALEVLANVSDAMVVSDCSEVNPNAIVLCTAEE